MSENMEVLADVGEVEVVKKHGRLPFPAVTLGDRMVYFNARAAKLMTGWTRVSIGITPEYIVILPATGENHSIPLQKHKPNPQLVPPVALTSRQPQRGTYKLLRYKDGFAFRRDGLVDTP